MIWHDDKLVQPIPTLIAITEQNLDQEPRPSFDAKDRRALP